jgi:3-deoxy-D-manno-octulosonic-acid transferase
MIEASVLNAYRGVMTAAAGVAQLASRLPAVPGHWRGLADRLGRLAPTERAVATAGTVVWLHAASVGELVAARVLLRRLRERFPERLYVVSTATRTGLALARTMPETHLALLLPLDAPGPVRRLLGHFRLEAFLFTETEVWPTLLVELAEARVPAFMVSGRVSTRTAARTRWLRPLYRRALASVTCCMQTEEDAKRIIALGADPRRVQVAGSLKFDGDRDEPPAHVRRLGHALGPARAVVAGSTHPGEDEAVLDAYRRVVAGRPDVVLVLAPRHPDRMRGAAAAIEAAGLRCIHYSRVGNERIEAPAVVLLDVMGALAHCYALGVAAFVGGSLVPVGGHNVLEPAAAARPVLVGPHTEHAAEVVERLVAGGAAIRVSSAESLAWALAGLLDAPERAADMGRRARALVESGQGAVERHLKIIAARLTQTRFARAAGDDAQVPSGASEDY